MVVKNIHVDLCRDPKRIEQILSNDYFDLPVAAFPRSLIRVLANWISKSDDCYLAVAEVDNEYAGFCFAHSLHPNRIWKKFALDHPLRLCEILWAWLSIKTRRHLRVGSSKKKENPIVIDNELDQKLTELDIQRLDRPFGWSDPHLNAGCLELILVPKNEHRGLGLSVQLVNDVTRRMETKGVTCIESHADAGNYASVKMFLRSGWDVFQMRGGDFYARRVLSNERIEK